MLISCTSCNTSYSVDDEKVANKKFGFTCPKCDEKVVVDNREKEHSDTTHLQDSALEESALDEPLSEDSALEETILDEPLSEDSALEESILDEALQEEPVLEEQQNEEILNDEPLPLAEEVESATNLHEIENEIDLSEVESEDIIEEVQVEGLDLESTELFEEEIPGTDSTGIEAIEGVDDIASVEIAPDNDTSKLTTDIMESGDELPEFESEPDELEKADDLDIIEKLVETPIIEDEGLELLSDDIEEFKPMEEDAFTSEIDLEEPLEGFEQEEELGLERKEIIESDQDVSIGEERIELPEDEIHAISEDKDIEREVKTDNVHLADEDEIDESITIDLDSLDIQLEEEEEATEAAEIEEPIQVGDITSDIQIMEETEIPSIESDDDMDITIDLDSLDLPLEEDEELKEGEMYDEEERITIEDTGTTIDDMLIEQEMPAERRSSAEEDLTLKIDEVAPDIKISDHIEKPDEIISVVPERGVSEEFDDIDLEEIQYEDIEINDIEIEPAPKVKDDFLDIETTKDFEKYTDELNRLEKESSDIVPGGAVNFSIDFNLKFSIIGALTRLLQLYLIKLFPHIIVCLIYSILSIILGMLNWLVVLFTGDSVEDFLEIQENTFRYLISLSACATDVVEESPFFAGKKDLDYSLQFSITYPIKFSRILAFLRISIAGIILIALPHIILLTILSAGSVMIYLSGIISIIFTKRWPNILFDFMVRYFRYTISVLSFIFGLVDKYPSFKFE